MKKKFVLYTLVLALFSVFISAALVSYLSNTLTKDLEVTSPLVVEWLNGNEDLQLHGGDTIHIDTVTTNVGDNDVLVYTGLYEIENTDGGFWEGEEFVNVNVSGTDVTNCLWHIMEDGTAVKFDSNIKNLNLTKIRLMADLGIGINGDIACDGNFEKYNHPVNASPESYVTVLTHPGMIGNYKLHICHLYSLDGECE